jgi:hypothetical protein
MGTTPAWLTLTVAVITLVGSLGGALAGQLIAGNRAIKLANIQREHRRDEEADKRREESRRLREEAHASLLAAARALLPALNRASRADTEPALAALRQAASYVEVRAPHLVDKLAKVMTAAEDLAAVAPSTRIATAVRTEAETTYEAAVTALRSAMHQDISLDGTH